VGPALYTTCHPDPGVWARSLIEWRDALQRLGLRPRLAQDCWTAASRERSIATFDRVQELLRTENSALAGAVLQILASLLAHFEAYVPDVVIYDWNSSGCLQANQCSSSTAEVVTLLASLQPRRVGVIGTELAETETVDVELFDQDGENLSTADVSFTVACFPNPSDLLAALDTADYVDRPEIAIAIALDRILPEGAERPPFQVLPKLALSLAQLSPAMRRSAITTMASALLPAGSRPAGLEEHALRAGKGGNDPHLTSRWGKAHRASVRKSGAGWRVHYWRGVRFVTFSNVCMHGSFEIFD
jgi:hypothetical protein